MTTLDDRVESAARPTQRCRLQPLGRHDLGLYRQLYCDPAVMHHIGRPLDVSAVEGTFAADLGRCDADHRRWSVRDADADAALGIVGADRIAPDCFELGILLLPAVQRRGLAAQALALAMKQLATERVPTVRLSAACANHAMARVVAQLASESRSFDSVVDGAARHWWLDTGSSSDARRAGPPLLGACAR